MGSVEPTAAPHSVGVEAARVAQPVVQAAPAPCPHTAPTLSKGLPLCADCRGCVSSIAMPPPVRAFGTPSAGGVAANAPGFSFHALAAPPFGAVPGGPSFGASVFSGEAFSGAPSSFSTAPQSHDCSFGGSGQSDSCCLCAQALRPGSDTGSDTTTLQCKHSFHNKCILSHLQQRPTCPTCGTTVSSCIFCGAPVPNAHAPPAALAFDIGLWAQHVGTCGLDCLQANSDEALPCAHKAQNIVSLLCPPAYASLSCAALVQVSTYLFASLPHAHIHTRARARARTHTHTHAYTHAHTHTRTHTHTHTHACTCACTHTMKRAYTHTLSNTRTHLELLHTKSFAATLACELHLPLSLVLAHTL